MDDSEDQVYHLRLCRCRRLHQLYPILKASQLWSRQLTLQKSALALMNHSLLCTRLAGTYPFLLVQLRL